MIKKFTLLLFILSFILPSFSAQAQVFVREGAEGTNDGTSWENAFTDLQTGIDASGLGGQVWVAKGTYYPPGDLPSVNNTITFPHDLELYGGFNGTEAYLEDRDPATNITILSGDLAGDDIEGTFGSNREDNVRHIMFLSDTLTTATIISGFTFIGGNTLDVNGAGDDRRGGAILSYGTINLQDCIFKDNYSYFGTVYPRGADASGFIVNNCTFLNNSGGSGAALYTVTTATGTITNCTFEGNNTTSRGGAVYVNNSNMDVDNCEFKNNSTSASTAGAIQLRSSEPRTLNITNSSFIGNSATWGGAVNTYDETSTTVIDNCVFEFNTSINRGGAIYMGFLGNTIIRNSEFNENQTQGSGGAISGQNDSTTCIVYGSEFRNNGPVPGFDNTGGAMGMFGGITVEVDSCIFEGNTAATGGAITIVEDSLDLATLTVDRSVFRINSALNQAAAINVQGAETEIRNSLFASNFNTSADMGAGGAFSFNTADSLPTNIHLLNCTVVDNLAPIGAGIATWTNGTAAINVDLENTILSNPLGSDYEEEAAGGTVTSLGGNLVSDQTLDGVLLASDLQGVDPMFADQVNLDYHLLEGSPCIDAGVGANATATDLDGVARQDEADIGCYEFDKTVNTRNIPVLGTLSIYPNPVKDELNFSLQADYEGEVIAEIVDVNGRVMQSIVLVKNNAAVQESVQLLGLPSGTYLLKLSNGKAISTQAFSKI